jgi:hypothetical protein
MVLFPSWRRQFNSTWPQPSFLAVVTRAATLTMPCAAIFSLGATDSGTITGRRLSPASLLALLGMCASQCIDPSGHLVVLQRLDARERVATWKGPFPTPLTSPSLINPRSLKMPQHPRRVACCFVQQGETSRTCRASGTLSTFLLEG